jgi:hypothetical protein
VSTPASDLQPRSNGNGTARETSGIRYDAKRIRDLWEKGTRSTRYERQQAAVNHSFLSNRQWVYWSSQSQRLEEVPRNPARTRATVPRIGPDSRRIISKLMRRQMQFDVPPTTPDDAAIRASRIGEAALVEAQRAHDWERVRNEHAWLTWEAGIGGLCIDWDWTAGTAVSTDDRGRSIGTGDVSISAVSLHEMCCEPGTREIEQARWWIRGVALPPADVQAMFNLQSEPKADARAIDLVWRLADGRSDPGAINPLTMVLTYYGRPVGKDKGGVAIVVNDKVVEQDDWPFPFEDRLNLAVSRVTPIHGRWVGLTPVSDAVMVQALYNASWSSIVEHLKLAGNARLFVPMGSIDDVEDITDTPGEVIEYNPINGQRPGYEAPPVMPDWWIRMPDTLGAALDDIIGIHDVSRGEAPANLQSGVALSILAESDDTPVGAFAKELGECWGRAASMVLKLWEANVRETRTSTAMMPGGLPEVIEWSGKDLIGQTTAIVPLDSVMPRSRAAQAAYALQLYDRQILKTPSELAKVADLPDQDDLLAAIDTDTARAQRENFRMAAGEHRTVDQTDDHANHLRVHRDFVRSERYEYLPPPVQEIIQKHMQAHEMYAADQGAAQTTAASVSPLAAALPTVATQPITPEGAMSAQPLSDMAPSATPGLTHAGQLVGPPGGSPVPGTGGPAPAMPPAAPPPSMGEPGEPPETPGQEAGEGPEAPGT